MTKRFRTFAPNRIVRQFEASAAYGANAKVQTAVVALRVISSSALSWL
jgi:hypothetical protein